VPAGLPTGASFLVVTQNIDGLHQRAGSRNVCEYHGSLAWWRCEVCGGELEPPAGAARFTVASSCARPSCCLAR
jgi:NAD-dependent deacetylase